MASNPIKRRSRQSFMLGFLIALVAMAVVVMFLFTKINSLNEKNKQLSKVKEVTIYTSNKEIGEGELITPDDLTPQTMTLSFNSVNMDTSEYIDVSSFDEEKNYSAKIKIPEGTVVTTSMIKESGINNDERLVEYNMIILPSQLKNEDYIDIRLRLANGTETIVLAKKKVEQCTATSIWMKMKEIEILTMNSAIVDAYLVGGAQLRATVYTNPDMQDATEQTYPVNNEVLTQITYNPNILVEAKNALLEKWSVTTDPNAGVRDFVAKRREIESYVDPTQDSKTTVGSGYSTEASDISTARNDFVTAVEGTGVVGITY